MEAKSTVRARGRQRRGALSAGDRSALDRRILARCQAEIVETSSRRVMLFLPLERLGEIDTWALVLWLWEKRRRIRVFVPRIIGGRIEAVQITPKSTFTSNKWGIPEPVDGAALVGNESLDLIVIPLLGFDGRGQRVGYGHGYFDRFLALHPDARRVGLAYECLLVPEGIAAESHDVPLHAVITEDRVYRFEQ